MRYGLTRIIIEPDFNGLKCSSEASLGRTTRIAARPGRLPHRWGPLARDQAHPSRLDRGELVLRHACKPRRRVMPRTGLGSGLAAWQAASVGGAPRSAGAANRAKRKAITSSFSSLSGQISKHRSLLNSRIFKISDHSSSFPPVPLQWPRSYDLRMDREGSQKNAAAKPRSTRVAAVGRGGGGPRRVP